MKKCINCGAEIKDNVRFCPKCGADQEDFSAYENYSDEPDMEGNLIADKKRKVKRNVLLSLAGLLLVAALCSGWFLYSHINEKKHKDIIYERLRIQFVGVDENDEIPIEAGSPDRNSLDFVQADSSLRISADPATIETCLLGRLMVTYTATSSSEKYSDVTKTFEQVFRITDTEAPEIQIKDPEVTVQAGTGYDPVDNVLSVVDSFEGELEYFASDESIPGSHYSIQYDGDLNQAGLYTITVYASDSSSNHSQVQFAVRVRDEERFVAIPSGCTSERKDYDKLFNEMEKYGKEYTSPSYSTKDEMRVALKEFERSKYPDHGCQVYPGLHITDGDEEQWIFYDYNPWND